MTRSAHVLWLVALSCLACDDGGSDAEFAPNLGFEDIEIVRPPAQGNGTDNGNGDQNGGGQPDAGMPDVGGSVAGNTAFPSDLQDIAGQLPAGVRPVEEFLPGFNGQPESPNLGPNLPPIASFDVSPDCIEPLDANHTFVSTSSDPDGDPLSCSWTFPGGIPTGSGACAVDNVSFEVAGAVTVELIVDDGRGGRDAVTRVIEPCS